MGIRRTLGGLVLGIGALLGVLVLGSLNHPRALAGPLALSLFPLLEGIVGGIACLGIWLGLRLTRLPRGWVLGGVGLGGGLVGGYHLWCYPLPDGAFVIGRYGSTWDQIPPAPWQHTWVGLSVGWLLSHLPLIRTSPVSPWTWDARLRGILLLGLWVLSYELFIHSFLSGSLPPWLRWGYRGLGVAGPLLPLVGIPSFPLPLQRVALVWGCLGFLQVGLTWLAITVGG